MNQIRKPGKPTKVLIALTLALIGLPSAQATIDIGPWVPIFKGIDHAVGTNTPGGGGFAELQVMNALRVDLTDPDIHFYTTPRISNYMAGVQETGGLTVSEFLGTNNLQAAINGNFFSPQQYYYPPGTPMVVYGLAVSEGVVVSDQEGPSYSASVIFDATNNASIINTNWPATSTTGIFTAVTGTYPVLINGINVSSNYVNLPDTIHQLNPRTAFGLSQDRRYLYLMTIDGRQPGYSDGSYDYETAAWLLLLGAHDGVNMDGGGSTTLVIQDTTGFPIELNASSAVADSGKERTVGSHFGIFAKPVPGFINDVVAQPNDTTAMITWTTIEPSTTQVLYDVTTNLTNSSTLDPTLVTNHTALLTGLTPATGYYFRALSNTDTNQYQSPNFLFVTTNYVTTSLVFDLTNSWKYTTANLDGVNWTAPNYVDSSWNGPAPAVLWAKNGTPNSSIPDLGTRMLTDPNNSGFPYTTYYFRTHFTITNPVPGMSLQFSSYIDDGAVFYLNGTEIYRVRMPDAPTQIFNNTLATTFPCAGDATCPDDFSISGDLITNLVSGDNVLAVEAHNYQLHSADVTFGTSLTEVRPIVVSRPQLNLAYTNGIVTLSWTANGFTLQQTDSFTNTWSDVPGPVLNSPFAITNPTDTRYYQLRK